MHVHTHTHAHTHSHTHTHMHTHTHTHAHMYAHTYTYMHMCWLSLPDALTVLDYITVLSHTVQSGNSSASVDLWIAHYSRK